MIASFVYNWCSLGMTAKLELKQPFTIKNQALFASNLDFNHQLKLGFNQFAAMRPIFSCGRHTFPWPNRFGNFGSEIYFGYCKFFVLSVSFRSVDVPKPS